MTPSQTLMFALMLIQFAASGYVLYACCIVLNAMSKRTRNSVRWTYLSLAAAAFTGVVCPPSIPGAMFAVATSLYFAFSERTGNASQRKSLP